jgi:hypothetical protein
MQFTKWFASLAVVAGMSVAGTGVASAQDWHDRDLRHDYYRADRMRDDMARDRVRLNEDIRWGRSGAAARDAADMARDRRALEAQRRDIRRDWRDRDYYTHGWR